MTEEGMADHPSARTMRERAAILIAAGNPIESVAGVFGMPVATLRALLGPAADVRPVIAVPASLPPAWSHFPGTVVYGCPAYGAVVLFIVLLIVTSAISLSLLNAPLRTTPGLVVACAVVAIACIACMVRSLLAARAMRFEMHTDRIVHYTPAGRTELSYADIVAMNRSTVNNGGARIALLTRHASAMTITPSRMHLADPRLAAWLDSIPVTSWKPPRSEIGWTEPAWPIYLMAGCQLLLLAFTIGLDIHTTHLAKLAIRWPTTVGIVTESAVRPHGGKTCRYPLQFRYMFTVQQNQYEGTHYRSGSDCGTDSSAIAAGNPVGHRIVVHYRPDDPTDSMIVPGGRSYTLAFLGCLVMVFCTVGMYRQARQDHEAGTA